MRNLRYITVEIGPCLHCTHDAGQHSIEGICHPRGLRPVDADTPRSCYRGRAVHAFVNLDEQIAEVEPVELGV